MNAKLVAMRSKLIAVAVALVAAVQVKAAGEWQTVAVTSEPTARHEAAMVAYQGKAYLMGGRGIKPVEEFDASTNTWRKLGPTPIEMHHFQPVVYFGQVYVMTAMTGGYPKERPLKRIWIYDIKTDSWSKGPKIPKKRRRGGAGTVVHEGRIYVVGGIQLGHTSGTVSWFDEFDPASGEWRVLPEAPRIRDHFSALVSDSKLYYLGGRNTSYHEPDNFTAFFGSVIAEVDVFDFRTGEWSTLDEPLPVPTAAGGPAELGGKIYYIGGESEQKLAHADAHRLDPDTGKWERVASLNRGRHGGGTVVIEGRIYFSAGCGNRGGRPELASTEVFTPER